jgi:GntR family transcriptional regulator
VPAYGDTRRRCTRSVRERCGTPVEELDAGAFQVASREVNDAKVTSTMDGLRVDANDPTLLHEQVAAEIRRAIADGEVVQGERLPPARDLAKVLGVNANTVLRSLRQLREEGLVEFRRGHGITVSGRATSRSAVVAQARDLIRFARRQGFQRDELIQIIEGLR